VDRLVKLPSGKRVLVVFAPEDRKMASRLSRQLRRLPLKGKE